MTTNQPTLPFSTDPIDWAQPVECKFHQLETVTTAAKRAGYRPLRVACITGGYRVRCDRDAASASASQLTRQTL